MENFEPYNFTDFIGENSLSNLATCSTIVGVLVQAVKPFLELHPLGLCFIFSFVLSLIKLILSGNYNKDNILLAIVNIIPMALTASGGYDALNKLSNP